MPLRHPLLILLSEKLNVICSYVQPLPRNQEGEAKKKVLVVHCHPVPESYSTALADVAVKGLKEAGHEVRVRRLYHLGNSSECYCGKSFPPALTTDERRGYMLPEKAAERNDATDPRTIAGISPEVAEAVSDLRWCDSLVLVYPTWWFNMPAAMKGFLDRTLLPGIAFNVGEPTGLTRFIPGAGSALLPGLTNIKKIGVITTYGSSYLGTLYAGDNSRRCVDRAVRAGVCHPSCLLLWHGLHDMDSVCEQKRAQFLDEVELAYRLF